MRRGTGTMVLVALLGLTLIGFSEEWWETASAEKESATRITYDGQVEGNDVRALADFENQYLEFEATGTVDMSEMTNEVQAEINAEDAAMLRAYAEAARFISGLMVGAVYGVEKGLATDATVVGKLEKTLVKYARVVDKNIEWRRSAPVGRVKLGILFRNSNGLIDMVMPVVDQQTQKMGITAYTAGSSMAAAPAPAPEAVTGLIIDARGLKVAPALAPMILTGSDNSQVYGNLKVDRDYAVKNGIVGYHKDLDAARMDADRVGSNPMVVKAVRTVINTHHVWISVDDATAVYNADQKHNFLKQCRVVMVVD